MGETNLKKIIFSFSILVGITILAFQNCGQPGGLVLNSAPDFLVYAPQGVDAKYESVYFERQTLPDLKIYLILDNSDSMRANQIRLKQSISNLFTGASENLSEFNSSTYLITTAQLPRQQNTGGTLGPSQALRDLLSNTTNPIRDPFSINTNSDMNFVSVQRNDTVNGGVTGLLLGDVLGFKIETQTANGKTMYNYHPAPVFNFQVSAQNVTPKMSIDYQAKQDLNLFLNEVGQRIDVINPDKVSITSNSGNLSMLTPIERESGLCALARLIGDTNSTVSPSAGDIASFIIVSDENDSDPLGTNCINQETKYNKEVYETKCYMPTARAEYILREKETSLNVRKPYKRAVEWQRAFTLSRTKKDAVCTGRGEVSSYSFQIRKPKFNIAYTKAVFQILEGGARKLYSIQNGLSVADVKGIMPNNCQTSTYLSSVLNEPVTANTAIEYSNIICTNTTVDEFGNGNFSNYKDQVSNSPCTVSDATSLLTAKVGSWPNASMIDCKVIQNHTLVSLAISSQSFPKTTTDANVCASAVAQACAGFNSCSVQTFTPYQASDTRNSATYESAPIRITQNLACDQVMCSEFPGLCVNLEGSGTSNSGLTLAQWVTSNGYTCSKAHQVTATVDDIDLNYTVIKQKTHPSQNITCNSSCDTYPNLCVASDGSNFPKTGKTLSSFYQGLCNQNFTVGSAEKIILGSLSSFPTINNPNRINYACSDTCINSKLCGTAGNNSPLSISDYITAQNPTKEIESCNIQSSRANESTINGPAPSALSCPAQYQMDPIILKYAEQVDSQRIDWDSTKNTNIGIKNFIKEKLKEKLGDNRYFVSSFVTKPADATSQFTAGTEYESLLDLLNMDPKLKGDIHNESSFGSAFSFLAKEVNSRMKRSYTVNGAQPGQEIQRIWYRSTQQYFVLLGPQQYTARGNTFTIEDDTLLAKARQESNVYFYVEYYANISN